MQESRVRQEIYRMLGNLGYWPVRGRDAMSCSNCGNKMLPPIGRPDIIVLAPRGDNTVVEVKVVNMEREKSFALDSIRPEQRKWLDSWTEAGGVGFLGIGTVNIRPRRLWLIPWGMWVLFETIFEDKSSIPVDLETYSRLPALRRDIAKEFRFIECEWIEGQWWLPENHWIRRHVDVARETEFSTTVG